MANEASAKSSVDLVKEMFDRSLTIFAQKNTDRGDIFKGVGAKGAYLELRSCVARLRKLIWEGKPPEVEPVGEDGVAYPEDEEAFTAWVVEVMDVCDDARNFSAMLELCVLDQLNMDGRRYGDNDF
jgi:hypothetical protein